MKIKFKAFTAILVGMTLIGLAVGFLIGYYFPMIISDGYNGTPSGFDNCCEDENGNTHWFVLHAEANAILKTAGSTHDCSGATLYLTMSPCKDCSKLVHQAGISRLVYINEYKDIRGVEFLREAGVEVCKIDEQNLHEQ